MHANRLDRLTKRERAVFDLLIEGKLGKEIGDALGIAESTVKGYRTAIYRKTGEKSVAGLVWLATENGMSRP